ncbi:MAG TPA: aspartyl/asparaginyl beta-hydroxylase domain-containing protein [Candidatus Cybelea sp.]|nr:aspartyl/asparaginyl beta-hydroxylase domain-containing protein [Candidatus Cybelea sp.]
MGARCLGAIRQYSALAPAEIQALIARKKFPCADAAGEWGFCDLWTGPAWTGKAPALDVEAVRRELPTLLQCVEDAFDVSKLAIARVFSAARYGFIRPHRDWMGSEVPFTRLHVPLQTNPRALNFEDAVVYHMNAGEIWYLDGSRVHGGGCLADEVRLHLVLDFAPQAAPEDVLRDRAAHASGPPLPLSRPAMTPAQRAALRDLRPLLGRATLSPLTDLLGTIHYDRQIDSAAAYDWLCAIAADGGDPETIENARATREKYLGPANRSS